MAAPFSSQTEIVLDAGADTSPASARKEWQVENTVDIVEDSIKDIPQAYRGGAVQSPQPPDQDEDEDLYDVSPQGKISLEKRKAAAAGTERGHQQSETSQPPGQQEANGSMKNVHGPGQKQRREDYLAPQNPVDELLTNGATVHDSLEVTGHNNKVGKSHDNAEVSKGRSVTSKGALVNRNSHASHELEVDDGGLTVSEGRQARSRRPAQAPTNTIDAAPIGNDPNTKASKNPVGSALAALRARQSAQGLNGTAPPGNQGKFSVPSPMTTNSASKKNATAQPSNKGRQMATRHEPKDTEREETQASKKLPSKTTDKSAQTPARKPELGTETEKRPTRGKLRSRRNGGAGQTPGTTSKASKRPTEEHDAADDRMSAANNIVADEAAGGPKDAAHGGKGSLKRPAKAVERDLAKQDAMLDIPGSPDAQDESRSSKKARTTAKSTAKNAPKATPKTKTQVRKAQGNDTTSAPATAQSRALGRPRKDNDQTPSTNVRYTNVRTRMMAQSEAANKTNIPQHSAATTDSPAETPVSPRTAKPKQEDGLVMPRVGELLEDFERSVMNFGDDPGDKVQEVASNDNAAVADAFIPPAETGRAERKPAAIEADPRKRGRPTKETLGASENNAIELSDREEPSSPLSSSVQGEHVPPPANGSNTNQSAVAAGPKTPTVYSSSPPWTRRAAVTPPGRVYDSAKERPNIISFSKSGPRNQGYTTEKKSNYHFGGTNRTLVKPGASEASTRARLEEKCMNGPSSATTSMKSFKTTRVAPPSNVAKDVVDALDGFAGKSKRRKAAFDTEGDSHAAPGNHAVQSQHSLPPPTDDDGFATIDDFEEATFVTQDTVPFLTAQGEAKAESTDSLKFTQPSAPKPLQKQRLHRAPTVPSMMAHQDNVVKDQSAQNIPVDVPLKRQLDAATAEQPVKKRARNDYNQEPKPAQHSERVVDDANVLHPAQKSKMPQKLEISRPEPTLRGSRKPSRVASHGSQKVDMHGSPVPSDMVVPEKSTVLETFTQQAHFSSQSALAELAVQRKIASHIGHDPMGPREHLIPPSHQPEPMSSNNKRLPAAPHEESQAITGFAKADSRGPLVQHMAGSRPVDPFTSSEEARKQALPTSASSTFIEQLRKMASESKANTKAAPGLPADDEDPDKTLVEPEPERPFRAFARKRSLSSASSSDTSSNTDDSSSSQHDIAVWRNALQPHQLNLFNELVVISHRLVQNLAEREIAPANIVEDYRSRGFRLVEDMELNHTRQLQKITEGFKNRKNRLRKELSDCGERLKACTASIKVAQRDSSGRESESGRVEESLQSILKEFC